MPRQVRLIDGRVEIWIPFPLPGGWVCAEPDDTAEDGMCGMPVESEPCSVHHPLDTEEPGMPDETPAIHPLALATHEAVARAWGYDCLVDALNSSEAERLCGAADAAAEALLRAAGGRLAGLAPSSPSLWPAVQLLCQWAEEIEQNESTGGAHHV